MEVLITGDFCPIHRAASAVQGDIFGNFRDVISKADLTITNLECPLTEHSKPMKKTGPALKAAAQNAAVLKENGINMVTLANNHIMDYGSRGLTDTISALEEKGISYIGAGKADSKIDVAYKTFDGITVAFVNLCENEWSTQEQEGYKANGFSEIGAFYSIRQARQNADHVIVIHHGGHENYNLPGPRLKAALRFFVDCGADAVINHHTHCISGHEVYNGKPVFYSIGNFVFDNPAERNSAWNYGMAVLLKFTKDSLEYTPYFFEQFNEQPGLRLIEEFELPYKISEINRIIQDDNLLEENFRAFVKQKSKMYNTYLEPVRSRYYNALKNRGILPSLWNKTKRYYLKNLISCESHREVVQEILKNETSHT